MVWRSEGEASPLCLCAFHWRPGSRSIGINDPRPHWRKIIRVQSTPIWFKVFLGVTPFEQPSGSGRDLCHRRGLLRSSSSFCAAPGQVFSGHWIRFRCECIWGIHPSKYSRDPRTIGRPLCIDPWRVRIKYMVRFQKRGTCLDPCLMPPFCGGWNRHGGQARSALRIEYQLINQKFGELWKQKYDWQC